MNRIQNNTKDYIVFSIINLITLVHNHIQVLFLLMYICITNTYNALQYLDELIRSPAI